MPPFTSFGESVANYLTAVGIRNRVRSMERATFFEAWRTKKLTGVIMGASAGLGNAAARLEAFVISSGTYAYGGHPDIDELSGSRPRSATEAGVRRCCTRSRS